MDKKSGKKSPCAELFLVFAKIGTFTLGGGYAMIAMMEEEIAIRRQYVSKDEFMELVAAAQACPGMFALNMAVFAGSRVAGNAGAIAAGLGVVLPSFFCLLLIAAFFRTFKENQYVNRVFLGLRPAVIALIAVPAIKMMKQPGMITRKNVLIPILATILVWLAGVSPVFVVIAAILGGLALPYFRRNKS